MLTNIDHIAIAVRDLDSTIERYIALTGISRESVHVEEVPAEHVRVAFLKIGTIKIELLEPVGDKGAIAAFLEKRGEGLHHIALETPDLEAETERTQSQGLHPLSAPSAGADNKKIVFFNPKDTNRVLIEFVQKM
ncbi:MAG TPA: methylmalonyl-CoA epimerase [Prosthecochloris aestuarii]|uniref:Methylmalonyl-CoA epimerase n=1 Tax=Prosthecochloris aestuarii TaxID=1102 RepID=A0A831WN47_PROAE|nr:methylmalonyl-CoA epimerase [Prosthecochloris aestuarii]